jgi:geranylgeranyl transferase type-2 subunit beta
VIGLAAKTSTFEHVATEHLRMSGIYWGLSAMALMGKQAEMETEKIVEWVMLCQHPNGSFGGNVGHDPHILYTLSAVQILAMCGRLDKIDKAQVASYFASLQQTNGSFAGDEWGEIDTRFSYCALSGLSILGCLESGVVDVGKACEFVASCRNFDGGFGCIPGAESHAGQVFCCVGALSIGNSLHLLDRELLGWWLAERQCDSGGLNGRPEKQADVCYSWWILSALSILGKVEWIDTEMLSTFILECQDSEDGGIADRPGNMADGECFIFCLVVLLLL